MTELNKDYLKILEDIEDHPEKHRHDFAGLQRCASIDGVLYMIIIDAHAKFAPQGKNGGKNCDVNYGPCACGAYH